MTIRAQNVHVMRRQRVNILLTVVLVVGGLVVVGCYERVVRESGPGSRSDIHEPNLKENPIERVIYGEEDD